MTDMFPEDEGTKRRVPASRGASTALFLGMVGLVASVVLVGGLIGGLAVWMGLRARRGINHSGGTLGGRAMATGGIVLGWLAIVIAIAVSLLILARRHGWLRL
jgi:uncharacterized Tic20 family protein